MSKSQKGSKRPSQTGREEEKRSKSVIKNRKRKLGKKDQSKVWKTVRGEERKGGEGDERREPFEQRQREWKPAARRIERKIHQRCVFSISGVTLRGSSSPVGVKVPDKTGKAQEQPHFLRCCTKKHEVRSSSRYLWCLQCWCKVGSVLQHFSSFLYTRGITFFFF